MRALLDFITKYNHWFLLVVLEGISLVLLFQFNRYHNSVWMTSANSVVGQFYAWENEALRYISLGQVNEDLMQRNLVLEQSNEILRRRIAELTHDSTQAERKLTAQLQDVRLLHAHVITNSVMHRDNFITIDRGTADSVQAEMGVVCGTGIVGIVYIASAHYAIVQPLLNSGSRISCRLRGSEYFGYLKWDGVDPLYATLDDIPRHARFKVGDTVETSGFSSVFPPGIFVGKVAAIEDSDDGLSYQLKVHLGTDFSRLQDVSVVQQRFQSEIHNLEHQADSIAQL